MSIARRKPSRVVLSDEASPSARPCWRRRWRGRRSRSGPNVLFTAAEGLVHRGVVGDVGRDDQLVTPTLSASGGTRRSMPGRCEGQSRRPGRPAGWRCPRRWTGGWRPPCTTPSLALHQGPGRHSRYSSATRAISSPPARVCRPTQPPGAWPPTRRRGGAAPEQPAAHRERSLRSASTSPGHAPAPAIPALHRAVVVVEDAGRSRAGSTPADRAPGRARQVGRPPA